MGPGYFVIAILGCADGSVQCTPVMTVPARYATESACAAAAPAALLEHNDFDFPSLLAECRQGPAPRAAGRQASPDPDFEPRRG